MDEKRQRFWDAVLAVQDERGRSRLKAIMDQMGMDVTNKGDRDLYREVMLALRDDGYIDCKANDYGLPCGIVQIL